jgi:hypothetical protein
VHGTARTAHERRIARSMHVEPCMVVRSSHADYAARCHRSMQCVASSLSPARQVSSSSDWTRAEAFNITAAVHVRCSACTHVHLRRTLAALHSAALSGAGPAGKPALSIAIEHGHERVISYLTGCKAVRCLKQPRRSTACEEPLTHSAAQLCDRTGRRAVCSGTAVRLQSAVRSAVAIRGGATITDCSVCVRSLTALGV